MLMLAMSVVLGLSYLSIASIKSVSSDNHAEATKAKYLAESGLEHAFYSLAADPDSIATSEKAAPKFYIDGGDDYYQFYALPDLAIPGRFIITAVGNSNGKRQTAAASVFRSGGPQFQVKKGMLLAVSQAWVCPQAVIEGDVHVNGSLINFAHINGRVTASNWILDPYDLLDNEEDHMPAESMPVMEWDDYEEYEVFGGTYDCVEVKAEKPNPNSSALKNAVNSNNPGGVVYLKPQNKNRPVTLGDNFKFTGTIIADSDIILDGANIELNAVDGFPAIVTSGRIVVTSRARAVINGLVSTDDGIESHSNGSHGSRTTINGGLVSKSSGYDLYLDGAEHRLTFDQDRCKLYDVASKNGGKYIVALESYLR